MSNDLKNILSNSNKDIDNQQLMDYLASELSKSNAHELETGMADDPFLNDAVEGLQNISPTEKINNLTLQLNQELQKIVAKNKKARTKRRWKDSPIAYLYLLCFIMLLVLCYLLVKKKIFNKPATTGVIIKEWVKR
ncbi:MAG: hypothetical protein RL172_3170 [Bacteroidota bacterium]|jgi:hypothetical protein